MRRATVILIALWATAAGAQQVDAPAWSYSGGMLVTTSDVTVCPYRLLEVLTVNIRPTFAWSKVPGRDEIFDKLRRLGAKRGADAVVLVSYGAPHFTMMNVRTVTATGRGIKYLDKRCAPAS